MAYPATFASIRTSVISKLRLDSTLDVARVDDWINQAYAQVATETRCFQQSATSILTSGSATYALPAPILHIELITCTVPSQQAWMPLEEISLDTLLNYRGLFQNTSGPPRKYALVGLSQFELWPTPGEADTLTFYYSYLPTALSADTDTPAFPEPYASKLLEFGACIQAAEFKRDVMMLGDFQAQYASWLAAFQRYVNRKAGQYPSAFPTWVSKQIWGPHDPSTDIPGYPTYSGL